MKSVFLLLLFVSINAFANIEGGSYFLPVEKISTAKDSDESAEMIIQFEGQKADIFRRSLPPITTTFMGLNNYINEIALIDENTKKSILITCSTAKLNEALKIEKLNTTKCAIRLLKHNPETIGIQNDFGNAIQLTSPMCQK